MHRTEKLRPVAVVVDQGRGNGPVFIAAALVAMGIAYVLLLAHPGLVHSVNAVWQRIPSAAGAPGWALPAVAAGVAIGGTAIGVALLSAFVRGVQSHPYSWLAPVLIGFSTLVMTGIPIELPWPMLSLRLFTVLAGLTVLGGGAVMQMRGLWSIGAGTLLLLLPMLTLLAGYAALPIGFSAALSQLDSSAQLFMFVLALTSVGIGFMAIVTERSLQDAALIAHRFGDQRLLAADARAAAAERRAQIAEQQLRAGGAGAYRAAPVSEDEAAAFAALARPGMSGAMIFAVALLATSAIVAGLYFALYRPLERRAAAQQSFVAATAKEHAAEIDSLRKRFQAQQATLQAQLASERAGAADAVAARAAVPEKAAVEPAPAPAAEPVAAAATADTGTAPALRGGASLPTPAAAKIESRRPSARKHTPARRPQRKPAAPAAAPAATTDANAEPAFDRETRRALRENIDDDPIGGLE
jgi:hypothetical protein